MLNEKAKKIWFYQNNGYPEYSYDFTSTKMSFESFEDSSSSFCWTIFNIDANEWITIGCSTLKKMPIILTTNDPFYIDGIKYILKYNNEEELYEIIKENYIYDTNTNILEVEKSVKKDLGIGDDQIIRVNENPTPYNSSLVEEVLEIPSVTIDTYDIKNENNLESSDFLSFLKDPIENNSYNGLVLDEKNDNNLYYKYWDFIYGENKPVSIDFDGKIIIKNEFRTNSPYSWDIDFFDPTRKEVCKFIASTTSIIHRNKKNEFNINDKSYKVLKINEKFKIIDPKNSLNILKYDLLINQKIDNYFEEKNLVVVPYNSISSILISFINLSLKNLEKIRSLIHEILRDFNVFMDVFIYSQIDSDGNLVEGKSFIRIYFRASNDNHYTSIFDLAISIKKIINLVSKKIINLNGGKLSYDFLLENHNIKYPFISWFTHHEIIKDENKISFEHGKFFVEEFFKNKIIETRGEIYSSWFFKTSIFVEKNIYECDLNEENITNFLSESFFE